MHPTWTSAARAGRLEPRALLLGLAAVAVALGWSWVCLSAYAGARRPQPGLATRSVLTRPRPDDFRDAADGHVLAAVAALEDTSRPATARLDAYGREARAASGLYAASLAGLAYQPLTIARLAALRFEEQAPLTDAAWKDWGLTLDAAARMAPRTASVHAELGELLVRMGRPEEALASYARALRLDPSLARRAVTILRTFGIAPEEAVEALPRTPSLLLALRAAYEQEGRLLEYADLLDPELPTASPELLAAWTDARLAARQAPLVADRLERLGRLRPAAREAARCVHLSRAALALKDPASGVRWAERARAVAPGDTRALEQSASAALAAEDPDGAVRFTREALAALARSGGSRGARARLYEIAGRAEERRGRMDAAHDAYARAVALDPNRTNARRRLEAMRAAAGLGVSSERP